MLQRTGAQIVIQLLERQGIRLAAGIPGGMNLPLYHALGQSKKIRHVLARHEQGAGFIAQGMARAGGGPAVCLATSGPGAANLLTAIADARRDSIPIVCLTGQVPKNLRGTAAFQEMDICRLSRPIAKEVFYVSRAAELLEVLPEAFRLAASGRPGPVLLDLPKDVQMETVLFGAWPAPGKPDSSPAPDPAALAEAARLINAAERPLFYLGGGAVRARAGGELQRAAERAGIPAVMSLMGLGCLPAAHPQALGMLGMHGSLTANRALEVCDLLIAVGARFDDRATGRISEFCPQAQILQMDIDPAEIGRLKSVRLGLVGDARKVMQALEPALAECARSGWREWKQLHSPDKIRPQGQARRWIGEIAHLAPDSAIVVTDVGQHQMWVAQHYPFGSKTRFLTSGGLGTMGFGLPAAIGAGLACPDKTVLCFTGDGSLLMNIQELATAAEERVNVKLCLFNNRGLGMVRQQQRLFYQQKLFASHGGDVDFPAIARGFGLRAYDLEGCRRPLDRLGEALAEPGPALIHLPVGSEEAVYPMVPPGAANRDMLVGREPES